MTTEEIAAKLRSEVDCAQVLAEILSHLYQDDDGKCGPYYQDESFADIEDGLLDITDRISEKIWGEHAETKGI